MAPAQNIEVVRRVLQAYRTPAPKQSLEFFHPEVERLIDAGGERVVALWRERGRAKASGVPMSQAGLTVYTVRDGLIASMVPTLERRAMLEALGLQAQ